MKEGRASQTALLVAFMRAVADLGVTSVPEFRDPTARHLLAPPWSSFLRLAQWRPPMGARWACEAAASMMDMVALRTVLIDSYLREALARGVRQVVILGAGLDGRAYRLQELAGADVFEVDHPATQAFKRARLGALTPTAKSLRFATANFETVATQHPHRVSATRTSIHRRQHMNSRMLRLTSAIASMFLAGPALAAETIYDSTDPAITYTGSWNHETSSTYYRAHAGTLSETRTANSAASLTFTGGSTISLVFTMGGNRWKSNVYIDGQLVETLNTRTPVYNQRWQVMKTWSLDPRLTSHTIEVVALGAVDGQDTQVSWSDVDAFIVDTSAAIPPSPGVWAAYPYNDPEVTYAGAWTFYPDPTATAGARAQSQEKMNSASFTFYGSSVRLDYFAGGNRGIAEIALDGKVLTDLDMYGPGESRSKRFDTLIGYHTLTVTVAGRKNALSTNDVVSINGFRVLR